MKRCPICGEENDNNAEFCSCCQTSFAEPDIEENRRDDEKNDTVTVDSHTEVSKENTTSVKGVSKNKILFIAVAIIIICIIVFIIVKSAGDPNEPSEDTYYEIGNEYEYILPYSDSIYYDRSAIEGMDAEETQLAINEIYARRGRNFGNEPYYSYFNSLSWYYGEYSSEEFDDDWFNEYEIANIHLLVEYAEDMGYR